MDRVPRPCPACETMLRPDARSCHACGARVPRPGAPASRDSASRFGRLPTPVKVGLVLAILGSVVFCCPIIVLGDRIGRMPWEDAVLVFAVAAVGMVLIVAALAILGFYAITRD